VQTGNEYLLITQHGNMKIDKKYIELIILIVVALASFLGGRATISPIGKVTYIKGETIHDTVPIPQVTKEYYTKEIIVPMKKDTQWLDGKPIYVSMKVDTASIIKDYTIRREYAKVLFDDKENGKLSIGLNLQYNKLQDNISYEFTPVIKQIKNKKIFVPFISLDYNSFNYVGVGGGVFYHNIGIEGKYITDFTKKGFEIGMKYKF